MSYGFQHPTEEPLRKLTSVRPTVPDDPLASKPPVPYKRSLAGAARAAVFGYHAPTRCCLRCGHLFLHAQVVVVARPDLPAETIHLIDLEADDQSQARPENL